MAGGEKYLSQRYRVGSRLARIVVGQRVKGRDGADTRDRFGTSCAVFSFADVVSEFYAVSSPKKPSADDEPGFRRFVAEWERRRGRAFGVSRQSEGPEGARPFRRNE